MILPFCLLLQWSITPGSAIVREIKPAAGIGWRNVSVSPVSDRYGNDYIRKPQMVRLGVENANINVRANEEDFPKLAKMKTVAVDMGENGVFAGDEFLAVSGAGSSEFNFECVNMAEFSRLCLTCFLD